MADRQVPGISAHTVTASKEGSVGVITLGGSVGVEAEEKLMAAYREVATGAKMVRWRFLPGTSINSAGIAVLITIASQARTSRQPMEVSGLSPHYRKIFDMIGLTAFVAFVDE